MRSAKLRPGDTVEVRVPMARQPFPARIERLGGGRVTIEPLVRWATWRQVRLSQVIRRLDPPPHKHRRTAA